MYNQIISLFNIKGLHLPTRGKCPLFLLTLMDAEGTHQLTELNLSGFTLHQKKTPYVTQLLLGARKGIGIQALMNSSVHLKTRRHLCPLIPNSTWEAQRLLACS